MSLDLYNLTRKYFSSFLGRTTQKQEEIKHLERYIPYYSPQLVSALKGGNSVNFLDIGAGTGKVSIPLLKKFEGINYSAREPNLGMGILLYLNYLTSDLPLQHLSINPDPSTDYGKEKYDFVLASHSLYYLGDWSSVVKSIYNSLVPGGTACIILGSKDSGLFKLRDKFFPQLFGVSPVPVESLESILSDGHILFTSHVLNSTLNISSSNLDSLEDSRDKNILEDGFWDMSLDSLFSFLLRVDYSKLPESTKEGVRDYINHTARFSEHLKLVDKAVWLYKKGSYSHEANPAFRPCKVSLGDLVNMFKPQFGHYFSQDVPALSSSLKESYFSALALDCVLSHWTGKLTIYKDSHNSRRAYNEELDEYMTVPIPGKRINEFLVYNPGAVKLSEFRGDPSRAFLLYVHNSDTLDYLLDHLLQEYSFLPEDEKAWLSDIEFLRLTLNIFKKFSHNKIFSSRVDGSTLAGLFVNSEYTNPFIEPRKLNPKLEEVYKGLGITPSRLCSREA